MPSRPAAPEPNPAGRLEGVPRVCAFISVPLLLQRPLDVLHLVSALPATWRLGPLRRVGARNSSVDRHLRFFPLLTTRFTFAPSTRYVLGAGFWEITRSFFTLAEKTRLTPPTKHRLLTMELLAAASGLPFTFGTRHVALPQSRLVSVSTFSRLTFEPSAFITNSSSCNGPFTSAM